MTVAKFTSDEFTGRVSAYAAEVRLLGVARRIAKAIDAELLARQTAAVESTDRNWGHAGDAQHAAEQLAAVAEALGLNLN